MQRALSFIIISVFMHEHIVFVSIRINYAMQFTLQFIHFTFKKKKNSVTKIEVKNKSSQSFSVK